MVRVIVINPSASRGGFLCAPVLAGGPLISRKRSYRFSGITGVVTVADS
jgi:hypothetical protein